MLFTKDNMSLTLKIDNRELASNMHIRIRNFMNATKDKFSISQLKYENLPSGDYAVSNIVGVERKKDDFITSLFEGLLEQQLYELRQTYKHAYLFIEFNSIQAMVGEFGVSDETITGSLASIHAHYHIPVILTGPFFVPILFKIIEKHYDGKDVDYEESYSPIRRVATSKEFKLNAIESAYHGLGISTTLAQRLLKEFHTPQSIFNATAEDLQKVKGIGEGKAKKMVKMIQES